MKRHLRTSGLSAMAATLVAVSTGAHAEISDDAIRIGFISDMSGAYADFDGPAGLEAVRMAVSDAGGAINGKKIEVFYADHQNKADVASARAREWFDQDKVDLLVVGPNSAVALAVSAVAAEKQKPAIQIGSGTADLTNNACNAYTVHYAYDTVALARGTGKAVVEQGGKKWFFLALDYAFGHAMVRDTTEVVNASGGEVLGVVKHPLGTSDFSSYLLQAQASKAQVLGLANGGKDFIGSVKTAHEFGLTKTMTLAGMVVFINDVHALGLDTMQNMYLTTSWYWDLDEASRRWSEQFEAKVGRKPSELQAADYSSVRFYLDGVRALGSDDGTAMMKWMKSNKIDDFFGRGGYVREDGRMIHDMFLVQVKTPEASKGPWDYYKVVSTLPGEEVYTTVAESTCSLMKEAQQKQAKS
nr:ABC transporter substrate-binding protein [Pseudomonas sp.]